jgi:hypothetical protein
MNTVVTVTMDENGIRVQVEGASSPEQVIYMLAQAQITIVTPEEKADEDVPELFTALDEEEEEDLPKVQ